MGLLNISHFSGIGYLWQANNIFPSQTVAENLMLAGMTLSKLVFVIDRGLPSDFEQIAFCGSTGIIEIEKTAPRFVELYETKYGERPEWVTLYGYSMAKYLLPIAIKVNVNLDIVRNLPSKVKLDTLRGYLDMGANRKVGTTCVVYVRKGGRFLKAE